MNIILLLVGLCLLVAGASFLVDGASSIARKAGISEFVIGLTIVGFGTSCPELVVSLNGAIQGNSEIAIGNVVGSNIFNILFILGCSGLITPLSFASITYIDIITMLVSGLMLLLWAFTGRKDRIDRGRASSCSLHTVSTAISYSTDFSGPFKFQETSVH